MPHLLPEKIFRVKVTGKGIAPGMVRSHELGELLISIEETICSLANSRGMLEHKEDLIVGLSSISHGSLELSFSSPTRELAHKHFEMLTDAFEKEQLSSLPNSALESLKKVSSFTRRHKSASALFQSALDERIQFTLTTTSVIPDPIELSGATTIFGRILRVGGRTPKVLLETKTKTVPCEITREMAITLGHRLYETVSLSGHAVWDPEDLSLREFTVSKIEEYEDLSPSDAFSKASKELSRYFRDVRDVSAFARRLRTGDKESD